MHINHILQRFRKLSGLGRALSGTLLSAAMLFQPFNSAWAVDRLSTGQSWFVLNETGIDTLGVQRLRITGPDADAFAIEGYTGSPAGMVPSQDVFTPSLVQKTPSTPLGVNLRFTPQHSGGHQASLEVTHDGSNASPASYLLKGTGAWDVTAQASTNTIDFGEQAMGMPAMTQDAFVRAVGAHGWLKVTGVKLEGSSDFTLAQVGLATKGSSTWGVGANLDVLPAGATESTKTFTAADVSVGGLTDGAMRVRYTPTLRGPQTAKLVVYHDGPGGQSEVAVVANGSRGTVIEVTQGNPYDVVEPVADFARVGFGAATLIKSVYLKAGGVVGKVTYSGFKVEGSSDIVVTSVGLYGDLFFKPSSSIRKCGLNADPVISYMELPEGGGREADFSLKGDSVSSVRCDTRNGSYITNRPHLQINLAYLPRTLGGQSAKITVYHDGNDEGFTTFDISGEAFWDTAVELRGNSPFSRDAAAEVAGFSRIGLDSAAQTKEVYLKASGTFGAVTYKGFKVEGSSDFKVTQAGLVYNWHSSHYCTADPSRDKRAYSQPVTYEGGARKAEFSIIGASVSSTSCPAPGKDFGLIVQYTPSTLGKQTATVIIYHDGNDEGFTTFDISGEAY